MNILYVRNYETGEFVPIPAIMGTPGISPVIEVTEIEGGHRITITDAEGTKHFDIVPGNGETSIEPGKDGVGVASVVQTTTSMEDGGNNEITVTLTNGEMFTFNVKNGSKGSKGDPGDGATINGVKNLTLVEGEGILFYSVADDKLEIAVGSHSQAASTITEGTFGGRVKASAASGGQTSDVSLLRNSKLVAEDVYDPTTDDPTVNGEIVWIYKAVT